MPKALRPYVAEGILEWNKAFEKLGYYNAIHVYQPGEYEAREEDIDPEEINYNFFRWITAEAGFAMGPSRVNPKTGEILDADIIFDDGLCGYWKQEYEVIGRRKPSPSSSDVRPGGKLSRSSRKRLITPASTAPISSAHTARGCNIRWALPLRC